MTEKIEKALKETERKYSKSAFLDAAKVSKERLLLNTLLEDNKSYTRDQVVEAVKQWKSKAIKKEPKEVKA